MSLVWRSGPGSSGERTDGRLPLWLVFSTPDVPYQEAMLPLTTKSSPHMDTHGQQNICRKDRQKVLVWTAGRIRIFFMGKMCLRQPHGSLWGSRNVIPAVISSGRWPKSGILWRTSIPEACFFREWVQPGPESKRGGQMKPCCLKWEPACLRFNQSKLVVFFLNVAFPDPHNSPHILPILFPVVFFLVFIVICISHSPVRAQKPHNLKRGN